MRIILANLPTHTPTIMPYSLAMMKSVLLSELDEIIVPIDLNSKYHHVEYNEFYLRKEKEGFFEVLTEFMNEARHRYPQISKAAVEGRLPKEHDYLMNEILLQKPDAVAISMTYNSQVFFAKGIIKELLDKNIKVIVGGPADYSKAKGDAVHLPDFNKLIKYLAQNGAKKKKKAEKAWLDYSGFVKEEYFTRETVYPLRTSSSCPYKRCAFCTHHKNMPYRQIELDFVRDAIIKNKMKKVFFIDDDFPAAWLEKVADMLEPLEIEWWCQLRPVKGIIGLMPKLRKAGLKSVAWGVESGSQRVLDFMEKGTRIEDIEKVLKAAKEQGIRNITYIMFGFPTESEKEFMETIGFLQRNTMYIDLVSTSVFGLQKGSRIYSAQHAFGVSQILHTDRTMLGEKVSYEPAGGLSQDQAESIKKKYRGEINRINKVPKIINSCKEQILNLEANAKA